jgi:hypothetical protein
MAAKGIQTVTAKDQEDKLHREAIARLAQAFKDLPDEYSRLDALNALTGIMKGRVAGTDGLLDEWMEQAHGTLKACVMLFGGQLASKPAEKK